MLQYKVSDLIKQARSKADLSNSDFITHEDDVTILNDIWWDLYQKAIDAGEKYFVKTIDVTDGMELPEDFFQLSGVFTRSGMEIPRRTINEIHEGLRAYEIENNRLLLKNVREEVQIKYYPKPATLTYPFKPKPYTLNDRYIAGRGNKVYSNVSVFDLDTNEETSYSNNTSTSLWQVYEDYIVTKDDTEGKFYFFDIQTLSLVSTVDSEDKVVCQDTSGDVYILGWSNHKVYDIYGTDTGRTFRPSLYIGANNCVLLDDDSVQVLAGRFAYWDESGDMLYTDDTNHIYRYSPYENLNVPEAYTQRGILLEDNPISGKGIWFNNTLYSTSKDILLNYPNNLFYSAMSYRLAVHYKIKQNEDATQLSALAEEAMYSYFDSITQDVNEFVRIKNVYN